MDKNNVLYFIRGFDKSLAIKLKKINIFCLKHRVKLTILLVFFTLWLKGCQQRRHSTVFTKMDVIFGVSGSAARYNEYHNRECKTSLNGSTH